MTHISYSASDVMQTLIEQCSQAGGQRQWARAHGFSDSYVSDVIRGQRCISEAMANALGYFLIISFRKIEKTS